MGALQFLPVDGASLLQSAVWYGAFVLALFAGARLLPGIVRPGQSLKDGSRLRYKLSGLTLFLGTHLVLGVGVYFFDWSLRPLLTHFPSLFVVANIWALLVTAYLMSSAWSKGEGRLVQARGAGPRLKAAALDIWLGAELNPSVVGVDLKMHMYHPSLIGLVVLNAAFPFAQYELYGAVTVEMWIYEGFLWAYLFTHYIREDFMLTTWDIIAERFGFMLVWGDLVYVPFLYSMVGWWVLGRGWSDESGQWVHQPWPVAAVFALVALHLFFHWVFRGANWQKDKFKRDPTVHIWGKPAEAIGDRLLVSGWWGIGRKINYSGELGVYLSFALCAGFDSPWPYFLPFTLLVLLLQRAWRDDRKCREKYGPLWDEYCARTQFRVIPFFY
ncbi:MAG: delta14-sterol reductase [Polyangiales bacterium]|jgi:delta14-sterol reductase